MRLSVEILDEAYWKKLINCQDAYPVHTDSWGHVRAVAAGDYDRVTVSLGGRTRWSRSVGVFAAPLAKRPETGRN